MCMDTYNRLIASAKAEQILSDALVHIDMNKLRASVLSDRGDQEAYRFLRAAIDGDGYIQSSHYSRDKRTFRIFPERGEMNLVNLSNRKVLESINSRYKGGIIVCIDYSNYEYRIFRGLFGLNDSPAKIHDWAVEKLGVDRNDAKALNNVLLYGNDRDASKTLINKYSHINWKESLAREYLLQMSRLRKIITSYKNDLLEQYLDGGYVFNHYGRKVYPKNEDSIFNTVIQSVGSEILVDVLIELHRLSLEKNWNVIFQRFDSVYFDFKREAFDGEISRVHEVMTNINPKIDLSATIEIGDNVATLKEWE